MTALTARQLRASLPHLNLSRTVFTAQCVGIVFWLIGNEALVWDGVPDRGALWSGPYVAYGLSLLLVILPLTVWWAPRASFLTAVIAGWWMATHSSMVGLAGWLIIGTAVLGLLLTLVADFRAVPTGPHRRLPSVDNFTDLPAGERSLTWYAAGAPSIAAILAIPVLLVWHHVEVQDQAAFEARADVVMATVKSFDFDEPTITVQAGETTHEFEWEWGPDALQIGDEVALYSDGEELGFVDDPADPSWMLGLAAGAPAFAVMLAKLSWWREWQRRRLVRAGGESQTVQVTSWRSHVLVIPFDGARPALEILSPRALDAMSEDYSVDDDFEGEDDEEWGDEFQAPRTREELVELANDAADISDYEENEGSDEAEWEGWFGPHPSTPEAFTMIGAWRWGSTVALVNTNGRVWLGEVAEAPPWATSNSRLLERLADGPDMESRLQSLAVQKPSLVLALRWAAVALWVAIVSGLVWLAGSDPVDLLDSIVMLAISALPAASMVIVGGPWEDIVMRSPRGVTRLGFLRDEHIGPEAVWDVAASSSGATVALGLKDDAVVIDRGAIADVRVVDAESAEMVLRQWLAAGRGGARKTLTPGVWGMLVVVGVAVATFVAYLPV